MSTASLVIALAAHGAAAASPPAPPKCGVSALSPTNTTSVAIPDNDLNGITSTIAVSSAGQHLSDVDVVTNVTHTFPGDIDMTITSPEGTVVTLTTDNGGTNDNVFAGTTWDDQADPASQIPYAGNPNIATDHIYANLTTASPLVPEEALGAFKGEDPNGTWTLKVSDDAATDTGTLNSWGLDLKTLSETPATTSTTASNATPVPIPDNNPAGASSPITISNAGASLSGLKVTTDTPHTFPGDIDMTLTSPQGTVTTLTTDNGGTNDNVFAGTTWNDGADHGSQIPYAGNPNIATDHTYANLTTVPQLVPEEAMSAFDGENPNGTWTLKVSDDAGVDTGTLNSWSLTAQSATCNRAPKLDPIANASVDEGQPLGFTVSASDPNGDPLMFTAGGLPPGASFDSTSRQFSWTPGFDQAGSHSVHFAATDGAAADSADVIIDVHNVDRAPTLDPISDPSVSEGQPLSFSVSASDPDSDPLTFSASGLPPGASFNPGTRHFSWTPDFDQAGSHPNVQFNASDGTLGDSKAITINVANVRFATKTTLTVKAKKDKLATGGKVAPARPGKPVKLTLYRKGRKGFTKLGSTSPKQSRNGTFKATFDRPGKGACKLKGKFAGDPESLKSSASKSFSC